MPSKFTKALAIIGLTVLAAFLVVKQLGSEPKNANEQSSLSKILATDTVSETAVPEKQQQQVTPQKTENFSLAQRKATTTDIDSSKPDSTELESSDVETTDVETTEVETTEVETTEVETTEVETTEVEITDFEISNKAATDEKTQNIESAKASIEENVIETSIEDLEAKKEKVKTFCKEFSGKLRTVKYDGCMQLELDIENNFQSVSGRSLTFRHFKSNNNDNTEAQGRILFISGIHGDEYSAISITYLWMLNMLKHEQENQQNWLFLPLSNPDGLFRSPATRINANNVDLNRNFPSPDWEKLALDYWSKYYQKNRRRYPGPSASSEPETQWMVKLIEEFKPDAIISVHAPYGLVDYDGPDHAVPNRIGALKHRELGTYPGSLGRYAGEYLKIPVLTLELRAAGSMPSEQEIYTMWKDVEEWTKTKIKGEEAKPILSLK